MANLAADPILTAIRGVIEDGDGTARTISASSYQGGIYDSLGRDAESTAALIKPRAEANIRDVSPHPAGHNVLGSVLLRALTIEVRLVRHLNLIHATSNSLRDDLKALATRDGDVIAQALTYPGNLTTDSGANATNLVSGCLLYQSSKVGAVELDGEAGGRIETVHTFSATATVTP